MARARIPAELHSPYQGLCRIDIACNDPDNGTFAGRAAMVHAYDLLQLESCDMQGPVFRELPGQRIRISRRTFKIAKSKEWFGNWCWNAYWLEAGDAVRLLQYLRSLGCFSLDLCEARCGARWDKPGNWEYLDREFLARQLVKEALRG